MRIKSEFIPQEIDGTLFLVPLGGQSFNGILKSNKSAAFILEHLKNNTDIDTLVDSVVSQYDVDRSVVHDDIINIIDVLRSVDALEE